MRCGAGEAAVHHPLLYAHPRAPARLGVCLGKTSGLLRDRGTAQAMHFRIYMYAHVWMCAPVYVYVHCDGYRWVDVDVCMHTFCGHRDGVCLATRVAVLPRGPFFYYCPLILLYELARL